jgi:CRISPR system Cascade subunit CasD
MSTLLIRLAAPLQAWGVDAKFDRRGTERVPTKSGLLGMVAAALGRRRDESLEDLQALRFGVRVEREGRLLRDFHTARSEKAAYVSERYYLADAVFLAGLEGDETLLMNIDSALSSPAFPPFLGRRSCPPEGRLSLGIRPGKSLVEALTEEPWVVDERHRQLADCHVRLRLVLDADPEARRTYFQRDIPLSFNQTHRRFGFRRVYEASVDISNPDSLAIPLGNPTQHDPMLELEG